MRERSAVAGAAPTVGEQGQARVVIATENGTLARLMAERLSEATGVELAATAESLAGLRAMIRDERPDVLVVDLALPTGGPDDICAVLPPLHAPERTIGVIPPGRSTEPFAVRGYSVGLGGLLVAADDLGNGQLSYAVRCVAQGKPFYGPTVHAVLAEHWGHRKTAVAGPVGLTRRELEVARMAAHGMSRTDIAAHLFLSAGTVKLHLRAVRRKLGVVDPRNREQLRRRLEEVGGLTDSPEES